MNQATITTIILFFLSYYSCISQQETILTPLQEKGYTELSKNEEIIEFLNKVQAKSPHLSVEILGKSFDGKPIPLIKVMKESIDDKEKLTILLFAQQHGNEASGKEGLLLLIKDIAEGNHLDLLDIANLLIIPQVNPDGGDKFQRRNAQDIDLNRDHLLLSAPESRFVQEVFRKYLPHVSTDIHEYYPFTEMWEEFGYIKNFDIQFGGLTNINIDKNIREFFYKTAFTNVQNFVEEKGYSFYEYTLGDFPSGERLRHSTVDVNDGRQSIGITNTISFIVEGIRGRDTLDRIRERAESQYYTALGIVKMTAEHREEIFSIVNEARTNLKNTEPGSEVSVCMDHFQGDKILEYPLKSIKTGKDTIFSVGKFHSEVKSLVDVIIPKGYLVPKADTFLCSWLKRSGFEYLEDFSFNADLMQYKIMGIDSTDIESHKLGLVQVERQAIQHRMNVHLYYYVPIRQLFAHKIVTALEPQAMYGLASYPEFKYLLQNDFYPVLRVE